MEAAAGVAAAVAVGMAFAIAVDKDDAFDLLCSSRRPPGGPGARAGTAETR